MGEFHFIRDEKVRETLQVIGAVLGVIGIIITVLSFIF
tara:strand:+ start:96 stop:209 length:114 start_codon:yes stop_codon:yes gene_type:complete